MPDPTRTPPQRRWTAMVVAALTATNAAAFMLPAATAHADPPAPPTNAAPAPPPPDPNAPPPDPNVPPPPPPAELGRVTNDAGGLSFVVPQGWTVSDASNLNYGSALLTRTSIPNAKLDPNDIILLGRLDKKLFAGTEPDNTKAAIRLASDMGQFFMPFPGFNINPEVVPLDAAGIAGAADYYDVKFTDTNKPDGQVWAAALGQDEQRWFVLWLGGVAHPVDKAAAKVLAESIRPWTPPPPPEPPPPDPNAPPPDPNAPPPPPGRVPVGVPVPVAPDPAMTPP